MTKGSRRPPADRKKASRSGRSVVNKSHHQHQHMPGNHNAHLQPGFTTPGHLSRANSGDSPEVKSALAEYEMHLALLEQEDENTLANCATSSSPPPTRTTTTTTITTTMPMSPTATSTSMAGHFGYAADQGGGRGGGGGAYCAYGVSSPSSSSSDVYSPCWSGVGSHDDTMPMSDGYVSFDYSMPTTLSSSYAAATGHGHGHGYGHGYDQRPSTGSKE